ncbi:MAG: aromatic ring-hydroxylating oxygenase subunit alpha [Acidimicrobiia bacterium]
MIPQLGSRDRASPGHAQGNLLPPEAYHDQGWFEREQRQLFSCRWALIADLEQLAEPGDYVTATVGLAPLVALRGEDGQLRAFHNLCRHRGMVLLHDAGNVSRRIDCAYHQWCYALDGSLALVPQRREQFPDLVPLSWGLLPASVAVWEGMVFVHPDPAAEPLDEALRGVSENLGSHRPGLLRQVAIDHIDAHCNWKLFVENHVDVYHLWYLHAHSLGDFEHPRFEYRQVGANWTSYEPLRTGDLSAAALTKGTTTIAHLDERDRLGLGAHMVFPNLLMATAAEFFATYVAQPVAPDHTVIEIRVRAEADADADALLDALRSFIAEDIVACEGVQAGVRSPAFAVGPLARDLELPITNFHTSLLARLGAT